MVHGAKWLVMAVGALALGTAQAHLMAGSLSIKANNSYSAGEKVNVSWTQSAGHNDGKYTIRFSKNGGTDWSVLEEVFQGPKGDNVTVTYPWTVPAEVTTEGKLHINFTRGGLTDANYNLISPVFAVTGTSALRPAPADAANPYSLRFNPATRSLQASFFMAREGQALIQAFDANGKLVATLLEGRRAAGSHDLSIFSNRLDASSPLVFQLRVGDQVHSQSWNGIR